ncbi:MAG TPA: Xaa-Pro dipeptidyl-peptidase [Streptosporangiaceae bacterium]|nr:Xaa-Pro dipeptidyl-peptidase [Streptosporangiaceae bacterium]
MRRRTTSGSTRPPRARRRLGALSVAAGVVTALIAVPAGAAEPPRIKVTGDETQPIFSRADAIFQTVHVETAVDSDGDGVRDQVEMRILRPKETDQGLRVPTIIEPSPYWSGGNPIENHDVDIDDGEGASASSTRSVQKELGDLGGLGDLGERAAGAEAPAFPGIYDNYFLPRGYAVADVDSIGTGGSTGCPTSGGRNETLGIKAAVDWLNGRTRGWDASGRPVTARAWSTGNVAMIGQSYNGTLPQAVASTGVAGLKTIVPIAAISSWYDYYRANGGVVAPGTFQGEDLDVLAEFVYTRADREICKQVIADLEARQDRVTGDYSPLWDERNYLNDARNVRASVFVVHGLNDWNVKTKHFAQWWRAMAKNHVPRKLWLHQAAHATPFRWRAEEWLRQLHHWFDYWLYGIQNGIMAEPRVDVERAPGVWERHRDWPEPGTKTIALHLNQAADGQAGQPGQLAATPRRGPAVSFVDQKTRTAEQLADNWTAADPNRLAFLTPELTRPLRVNGTPEISVRASLDGRSPFLTALLVDYGTDTRPTGALVSTGEQFCYGPGVTGDTGCTTRTRHVTETAPFRIVTRGWLDVRNRHDPARTEPITPGTMYSFRWDMQPNDYVFKAGHRIGVVVLSTDFDYTLRYPAGTQVALQPGVSQIRLPIG